MGKKGNQFQCLNCGSCCVNLHTKTKPKQGLGLSPDEIHLFPSKYIIPALGFGKWPKHKSFKIFMYQMTEKICPHYSERGCSIYSSRPRHCKAYPISVFVMPHLQRIVIDPDRGCTWIKELYKKYPDRPPPDIIPRDSEEFKTAYFIHTNGIKRSFKHWNKKLWAFDVKKRKWSRDVGKWMDAKLKRLENEARRSRR